MNLKRAVKVIICLLGLFFGGLFFWQCDDADAAKDGEIYIQVSPTTQKLDIRAGEHYSGEFRVRNIGNKEFEFGVKALSYQPSAEDYGDGFELGSAYRKLPEWITFEQKEKRKLAVGEAVVIRYYIDVPKDVPAGGQYAMLVAEAGGSSESGAKLAINSQVGMTLYANVAGETRMEGKILQNDVQPMAFGQPITGSFIAENTGNVDFNAEVETSIYNFLSNEEIYTNREEPYNFVILPESKRNTKMTWSETPQFGLFKVVQKVRVLDEENIKEQFVWVCPVWLLFVVIILLAIGLMFIILKIIGAVQGTKSWG